MSFEKCPFCRSDKIHSYYYDPYDGYQGPGMGRYYVTCKACGAEVSGLTEQIATEKWNRRAMNPFEVCPGTKGVNPRNKFAEFACRVCHRKIKEENPGMIDCAWRGIDNEYCPELLEELEKFAHENR